MKGLSMNLIVCSVFDSASSLFGRPFYVAATGQAIRSFTDEINNKESELGKHPSDYELFCLCTFDDNKGVFRGEATRLVRGVDVVVKE